MLLLTSMRLYHSGFGMHGKRRVCMQAGFEGQKIDSTQMLLDKLDELVAKKLIPDYKATQA